MRRALELPGLRGGLPEVLAGADRRQRTVRWVHAGEVPDIASLLKGGEPLLTTGYGLGTRPADQRSFMRTVADRGIAALVVVVGVAGGWAAASAGLRHAPETATAAQDLPERRRHDARRLDIDLLLWRLRDHPDLTALRRPRDRAAA